MEEELLLLLLHWRPVEAVWRRTVLETLWRAGRYRLSWPTSPRLLLLLLLQGRKPGVRVSRRAGEIQVPLSCVPTT